MNRIAKQQEALQYLYENSSIGLQQAGTVLAAKLPLIATVAFSSLLFIPQLREIGALGMRASALYTAGALTLLEWNDTNAVQKALNLAKVGAVALGIIGLAAGSTACMVTGMTVDAALQLLSCIESTYILSSENLSEKEKEEIVYPLMATALTLVVDILVISSLCSGLVTPLIVGGLISYVAMSAFTGISTVTAECLNESSEENKNLKVAGVVLDVVGYLALTVLTLAQAIIFAPDPTVPKGHGISLQIHNRNWTQIRVAANQTSTSIDYTKNCQYAEHILSKQAQEKVDSPPLSISSLYNSGCLV